MPILPIGFASKSAAILAAEVFPKGIAQGVPRLAHTFHRKDSQVGDAHSRVFK